MPPKMTRRTTQMGTGKAQQLRESLIPEPEERDVPRRSKAVMPDLRSKTRSTRTSDSTRRRSSRRRSSQLSQTSQVRSTMADPNSLAFKLRSLAAAAKDAEVASLAGISAAEGADTGVAQEGDLTRRFTSAAAEGAAEPPPGAAAERASGITGKSLAGRSMVRPSGVGGSVAKPSGVGGSVARPSGVGGSVARPSGVGGGEGGSLEALPESDEGPQETDDEAALASPEAASARYFRERLLLDLLRRSPLLPPPPRASDVAASDVLRSLLKDVLPDRASAARASAATPTEPARASGTGPGLPDEWRQTATRMPLAFQEQLLNEQNVGLREGPGASDAAGLPFWPGRASGPGAWARRRDTRPHTVGGRLRCGNVHSGRKPRRGVRDRARVGGGGGGGGPRGDGRSGQRPSTQPGRVTTPPAGAAGAAARPGVRWCARLPVCGCVKRARARRVPAGAGDRPPWVGPCSPSPPTPRQREATQRRQSARVSAAAIARRTAAAHGAPDKRRSTAAPSAVHASVAAVAAAPHASVAAAPHASVSAEPKSPHHKKEPGAKDNGTSGNGPRGSIS